MPPIYTSVALACGTIVCRGFAHAADLSFDDSGWRFVIPGSCLLLCVQLAVVSD